MSYNVFKSRYNANFKIFAQSNIRQSVRHRLYRPEYLKTDLPERLRLLCPNDSGRFERTMDVSEEICIHEWYEWVYCNINNLEGKACIIDGEIIEITEINKI